MRTALRLLTTALVGWAGAVSSLTVLFGNPMAEQLLFTEAAGQSEKALSVWLHQDPLPAVTPLWGALTDIDGRGLAVQGMVLLWALGLVAVYALGWAHRPGPAWRRGATFGIAVWAMVYVFLEVWVPFNLLGEPFHLFALELALGLVAMVAAVVAIAGAHSRLATHSDPKEV